MVCMASEKLESGICIACGREVKGIPARQDFVIRAARKMRAILRMAPHHTVVENAHFEEAKARRANFEKSLMNYRLGAVLFFLFFIAGGIFFGGDAVSSLFAAAAGAIFIALLPYLRYYPKFDWDFSSNQRR